MAACLHAHTMISISDISSLSFNPCKKQQQPRICNFSFGLADSILNLTDLFFYISLCVVNIGQFSIE